MAAGIVPKLYQGVIDDVMTNVREAFLDEGVDEQILFELKQTWEKKLIESKAVIPREPDHNIPYVTSQRSTQHTNAQQMASNAVPRQLTLPAGSLVPQALLQAYASGEGGDGQKGLTLLPQKVTITLPANLTQQMMSGPAAQATLALPPEVTARLFQTAAMQGQMLTGHPGQGLPPGIQLHQVMAEELAKQNQYGNSHSVVTSQGHQQVSETGGVIQLDGAHDTSDDDDDDDYEERDNYEEREENEDEENEFNNEFGGPDEEEEPLNSEDDVSDDDPSEAFDTDNVVVCQYDKITRSRNKWKFHFKDGIMNLQGKDFVFQKAIGDAEW